LQGEAIVDAGCVCRRPTDEPTRDQASPQTIKAVLGKNRYRVPTPSVPGSARVRRPARRDRALV